MFLTVDPNYPKQWQIRQLTDILDEGGCIAYPTDTLYAMGCRIDKKKALLKMRKIKNLKANKPLTLLVPSIQKASKYALISNRNFHILKEYTPGPYTFVLPPTSFTRRSIPWRPKTIGLRIPEHPFLLRLLESLTFPLANTSILEANGNGLKDPLTMPPIFYNGLNMIVDVGIQDNPSPSTVIDMCSEEPVLIRKGKGNWID